MTAYSCSDCRFRFEAASPAACPRCGSVEIGEFKSGFGGAKVIRDGKDGWQDFHSQRQVACPNCGGRDFELNYKRKERTCRKCGEVLALPRRFA